MTTLYYCPGTCAIGIHVLLEEVGKPYEIKTIHLAKGEQFSPEFTAISPKSKVPALVRDDGSVLTEFTAIALWLALANPEKKLVPTDTEGMVRAIEAVDYAVATCHMQGWTRHRRPMLFAEPEGEHPKVQARGREIFDKGMKVYDAQLAGKDYLLGDYSIADAALYYLEFWAAESGGWELPPNVAAHYERMKKRPAVQASRKQEGVA